jgi:hypothetical protein
VSGKPGNDPGRRRFDAESGHGPGAQRIDVESTRRTARRFARRAVVAWLLVALVLAVVVAVSNPLSKGEYPGPDHAIGGPGFLHGWYQFDAGWYELVATRGYYLIAGQSPVAFFPAYPLALRWIAPLLGDHVALTGTVVTFFSGVGAVALFAWWCRDRLPARAAAASVALLVLYPYSWYLVGAIYADAFFLLFTIAAFVALERGHPLLAGLLGAVATATRPVGAAVVAGLAIRAAERRGALRTLPAKAPPGAGRLRRLAHRWRLPCGLDRSRLRLVDLGVLLSAAGFLAYAGYLWARFGDPLAFSTVQKYWDQPSGPVTLVKAHLWGNLLRNPISKARYLVGCLFQGALTVGALLAVPRVARRFGWGYGALVLVGMGLPFVGSKDFQGTGRYLLAAFPLFALGGEWLAHRSTRARALVLVTSAALLLLGTHLFARGFYVA